MGPGGMPINATPVPSGDTGRYAFLFPLRPGETRFQASYRVPYTGNFIFDVRPSLPTATIAVVLPVGMTFGAGDGASFEAMSGDPGTQTFLAKNVQAGGAVTFHVTGTGTLPKDPAEDQAGRSAAATNTPISASNGANPAGGSGQPLNRPGLLDEYQWWALGGSGLLLAAAAGWFLRRKGLSMVAPPSMPLTVVSPRSASKQDALLVVLKEELFILEAEWRRGKIADIEYRQLRAALETVLKRALRRQPAEDMSSLLPETIAKSA
jgi:hypothetical protein